jgi:hypothetical protein
MGDNAVTARLAKDLAVEIGNLMAGKSPVECMTAISVVSAAIFADSLRKRQEIAFASTEAFLETFEANFFMALSAITDGIARRREGDEEKVH